MIGVLHDDGAAVIHEPQGEAERRWIVSDGRVDYDAKGLVHQGRWRAEHGGQCVGYVRIRGALVAMHDGDFPALLVGVERGQQTDRARAYNCQSPWRADRVAA